MKKQQSAKVHSTLFGLLLLVFVFFQMQACGSSSSGTSSTGGSSGGTLGPVILNSTSGTIVLQFSDENVLNASSSLGREGFVSSAESAGGTVNFGMKFIAAYLAEDIDPETQENVGQTFIAFLNEQCNDNIMNCDISDGIDEMNEPYENIVTDFFNFTDLEAVNEAVNEQHQEFTEGTYRYARMEFCKTNSASANNIEWSYVNESLGIDTGTVQFIMNNCATADLLEEEATLTASDSATYVVQYDLSHSITVGPEATGDSCTGEGSRKACFSVPDFRSYVILGE